MANASRRELLVGAAGIALHRTSFSALPPLRVQYTTGGHTVPLQQYAMFDDDTFRDLDTWVVPHPRAFDEISGGSDYPAMDVVVLGDYLTANWPETDQQHMRQYVESGKGLVVLHHSVGDNQNWPWWYENVLGGALVQQAAMQQRLGHHSSLKQWPRQRISPVGDHPIVRDLHPFLLPRDELFTDMWFSPTATILLRSDDPDLANNGAIAWVGVHPKTRVVCLQPGHTDWVNQDPIYRHIVHNMILWAGRRLA